MTRTITLALCLYAALPVLPVSAEDRLGSAEGAPAADAPAMTDAAMAHADVRAAIAADAELAAFQHCKTSCAPQCDQAANLPEAERCQQACEHQCNVTGGK